MSLSPDAEKGFQLDSTLDEKEQEPMTFGGRRRTSPNSDKLAGHADDRDEEIASAGRGRSREKNSAYLGYSVSSRESSKSRSFARDGGEYSRGRKPLTSRNEMHQRRLWPSPRAAYGWLHAQSGYIFLLVVFTAFLRAGLHAAAPPSALASPSPSPSSFTEKAKSWLAPAPLPHPIPGLMDAADARFRAKLARQSPSLAAAVAEYTRRYARPPPAGFDKWYAFVVKHKFVMIDEFDSIHEDLAPFWRLDGGGAEIRERARLVGALPSVDLVRVRGGKAETIKGGDGRWKDSEVSARANGFKAMMGKFVKDVRVLASTHPAGADPCAEQLPDMDFPINAKAEGRVVVPWEHTVYPNMTDDPSTALSPTTFKPDWAGAGSVWDAWRRTCAPSAPARRLYSSVASNPNAGPNSGAGGPRDRLADAWRAGVAGRHNESATAQEGDGQAHPGVGAGNAEFAFAPETGAAEVDFCARPAAHYEQGHFFSDWRVLPVLVPVFSPARGAGFGDIRVPSHYYYGGTKRYTYAWDPINLEQRAVDAMEVPWEEKRDVVWWRGASTGGGSSPAGFGRGYQRHRFLRMSSVGLVPGTRADAQRTTAVTFAVPLLSGSSSPSSSSYSYPSSSSSSGTSTDTSSSFADTYATVPVPLAALNADIMDTAFVKAVVPVGAEHRFGDSTELGAAWAYKYLLDLDGMGYSGRFMAFLASDSVPVKATVYDEFFSGWIEPWVHYIPLSATYAEIYNIVAYFSGPPPSTLRAAGIPVPPISPSSPSSGSSDSQTSYGAFRGSTYRAPGPVDDAPEDETAAGLGMGADGVKGGAGADGGSVPVGEQGTGTGASDAQKKKKPGVVERPLEQVERRGVVVDTRKQDSAAAWMQDPAKQQALQQEVQAQEALRSAAQEEGDRRLRRIARAGKQWKNTIGRTIDMEVYVYRLALEYARLWSDDREAMSYKP
ncbi:hypothetical protein K438DRAFT_1781928 [Mycena galopus ATCC 62051]|nr:hypothetical protein K438DRAFT_1781928 [Mycena galopus ATCC 62051]